MNERDIHDMDWEDNSDDDEFEFSRLYGSARFYGVNFHVTAIAVTGGFSGDSEQRTVDPGMQGELDAAIEISGAGPLYPVQLDFHAGDFVLIILPFAA
jgi:hypothetical protein